MVFPQEARQNFSLAVEEEEEKKKKNLEEKMEKEDVVASFASFRNAADACMHNKWITPPLTLRDVSK